MPSPTALPASTKLVYGFGSIAEGVKDAAFRTFLLFYYNQALGLPGWMGGAAAGVALVVDAIVDPLIGSLSDGTHTRWGRRHPYMYAAILPMAVSFYFLFHPPSGLTSWQLFGWLTTSAVLVRSSMALYSIPSNSMVAELTSNYDERTSLVGYRYLFGWIGGGIVLVLGYGVFMADSLRDPAGYGRWATIGACLIAGAILVCALGTHRLIPTLKPPPDAGGFTLRRFRGEIREALANPSYRTLVLAAIFASVGGAFTDVFGLYLNTYFWEFRTEQLVAFVPALVVGIALGVAIARPLSVRFEKRGAALTLATLLVTVGPLPILLRLANVIPHNGSSALLGALVVHVGFLILCSVAVGILIGSMISDTIDQNELATGKRQEGIFSSAIAFSAKAATGVGTLLAGMSLDLISFPRPEPGATAAPVSADQVTALGLIVGPGLMGLWVLTLYFLSRYQLTREEHARVLAALASRERD